MTHEPTAEELGDMLEAGEISRAEVIEIMDRRAREEALKSLYAAPGGSAVSPAGEAPGARTTEGNGGETRAAGRGMSAAAVVFAILLAAVLLLFLLCYVL